MTIRDRMLLFYTYEDDRDMKFTDKDWFRFRYKIDPNSPNAEKCRDMMMYYIETNGWHRAAGEAEETIWGMSNEGDEHIAALAASSSFEEVFLETRAFTEFTWWEGDVEEDLIEDWLSLGD